MKIFNLSGIFSGQGFLEKSGRKPTIQDCAFLKGPLDILIDEQSGTISEIKNTTDFNLNREAAIDGTNCYVSAGMIDSHTHALFEGERTPEFFLRWKGSSYQDIASAGGGIHNTVMALNKTSDFEIKSHLTRRLLQMASLGSTTIEVKSGYADDAKGELRLLQLIKQVIEENRKSAFPKIRSTFLGLHYLPKAKVESAHVDEMISILPIVRDQKLAQFVDAFPEKGFFSTSESMRFCVAAKASGLKAKIHSDELSDLGSSHLFTEFGALSVDHLQKISEEGIQTLAVSNTIATLMPATSFFLGLPYTNARKLIDSGVRVALATDFNPGTAPDSSLFFTHRLAASQMKMSAAEILCASTVNAAQAIGESTQLGIVKAGFQADLLLWKAPNEDPERSLQSFLLGELPIEKVLLAGKILR